MLDLLVEFLQQDMNQQMNLQQSVANLAQLNNMQITEEKTVTAMPTNTAGSPLMQPGTVLPQN